MIGLIGRAGAGKTFVANELFTMNQQVSIVSFAAQLRAELEAQLGVEPGTTWLWDKPLSPALRWILQQYGTNYRRAQDPDYWVKKGMAVAEMYEAEGRLAVFDDVRFPNEANAIVGTGGLIVRVVATEATRRERLGELPPDHPSETSLDDYKRVDYAIAGVPGKDHDTAIRNIMIDATFEDVDFMGAISESLANRE